MRFSTIYSAIFCATVSAYSCLIDSTSAADADFYPSRIAFYEGFATFQIPGDTIQFYDYDTNKLYDYTTGGFLQITSNWNNHDQWYSISLGNDETDGANFTLDGYYNIGISGGYQFYRCKKDQEWDALVTSTSTGAPPDGCSKTPLKLRQC
ncbi:hypothetical protein NEOLI_002065 [Neolecta irregularis DAH-3]|uniref:Uncharacterized protein n=1 Tax=Neolecta irregularis (strain DAH-3) TaxID=1198029 RepID=A0A1U7LSZ3_NEOID|nr:hypothetical protein NEOLI_002065 [Neolecta irregularis DAH-3]|eukprot:OLL25662.1 hypothetical protein NEOLI_002065 [Neolecta irregularis DAH-3]